MVVDQSVVDPVDLVDLVADPHLHKPLLLLLLLLEDQSVVGLVMDLVKDPHSVVGLARERYAPLNK